MDSTNRQAKSGRSIMSRYYESELDLQRMLDLLVEARSLTNDWRYWHVGELAFNYFMVACHLIPQEHIRLWHDGGRLVGFAILGEDPAFDCQVSPGYEWSGIEMEALEWAGMRLTELRQRDAGQWGGGLVSGTRQDDVNRIKFLEDHDFRYRGEFTEVNMLRSLDEPVPEPKLPAGYQVRAVAETGETSKRAAVHRQVWQPWIVGNVSDENYTQFMRLPIYIRELDIVAIAPDGVIAAYVNGWVDPTNRIGDFGPVGAHPAYRRQGLARAVLLEGLRRMQTYGMNRVCVSTGESNHPALGLYQSVGFEIVNKYLDYMKPE